MRIYTVRDKSNGKPVRYVRAHTLNGAIRAVAAEQFTAEAADTEDLYQAMRAADFKVLDAIEPEQVDIGDPKEPAGNPLVREAHGGPEPVVDL